MRFACALLLLAAACGDDDVATGTIAVSWSLRDMATVPTCDAYQITDIVLTDGGSEVMASAPCAAGMLVTDPLPLGTYAPTLAAVGTQGDTAGTIHAPLLTLTEAMPDVTLAPLAIPVSAPTLKVRSAWRIMRGDDVVACGAIANGGVQITITPDSGSPITDVWDCDETAAIVDAPYGPFTETGTLLSPQSTPLGVSTPLPVPAGRGDATVVNTIEL